MIKAMDLKVGKLSVWAESHPISLLKAKNFLCLESDAAEEKTGEIQSMRGVQSTTGGFEG